MFGRLSSAVGAGVVVVQILRVRLEGRQLRVPRARPDGPQVSPEVRQRHPGEELADPCPRQQW